MARRVIDAETPGLVTTHRKEVERPFRGSRVNPNARACHALGDTCPNMAMPNGTCHAHGGKTPSGIAASRYVHGRYSRVGPQKARERYGEALHDPEALSSRHEVAQLDTRIGELLDRLPEDEHLGETQRAFLSHFAGAMDIYGKAKREQDEEKRSAMQSAFYAAFENACVLYGEVCSADRIMAETWSEVYAVMNERRKHLETELIRLKLAETSVHKDRLNVILGEFGHLVRDNVTDTAALRAIANGIREIGSKVSG